MNWQSFSSADELSAHAAQLLLASIRDNPRVVLGLPTGRTPIGMYDRVVRECGREYHCFRDVTTFNLDEYAGVAREHPGSYFTYMKQHLFDHVDLNPANAHLPHGNAPDLATECAHYEQEIRDAGGLDVTILGLGRNG
ncbi:MAG TPA: 6-phosphogluconolactonase, partial [Thermoanaerobaculia bacterium]|nr:6-phosphogluconolactonase [Thermoanaerobaculia bacterium]